MNALKLSVLALTLCAVMAGPALAKKPDFVQNGKGHEEEFMIHNRDNLPMPPPDRFDAAIDPHQRELMQSYLGEHYHKKCPPGLAKKHNGCVPPGLSKQYVVGDILPQAYQPLPDVLVKRLGPPPQGTFYAMVDSDVVLVAEAGKKILDAVTLLSAVK